MCVIKNINKVDTLIKSSANKCDGHVVPITDENPELQIDARYPFNVQTLLSIEKKHYL